MLTLLATPEGWQFLLSFVTVPSSTGCSNCARTHVSSSNCSSELSSASTAVKNEYDTHEPGNNIVPVSVENGNYYASAMHHIGSPLVVSSHSTHHMNGAFKFLLPPPMIGSPVAALLNHQRKNGFLHREDSPPRISVLMTINVQDQFKTTDVRISGLYQWSFVKDVKDALYK